MNAALRPRTGLVAAQAEGQADRQAAFRRGAGIRGMVWRGLVFRIPEDAAAERPEARLGLQEGGWLFALPMAAVQMRGARVFQSEQQVRGKLEVVCVTCLVEGGEALVAVFAAETQASWQVCLPNACYPRLRYVGKCKLVSKSAGKFSGR